MATTEHWLNKIDREVEMILEKAPPCPDPVAGGCIGEHCIYCAAREISGSVQHLRVEAERR